MLMLVRPHVTSLLICIALLCVECTGSKFRWTAAIDRDTGIATSREISDVSSRQLSKTTVGCFSRYPQWLATPNVSFGMLKAVNRKDGSTILQDRFLQLQLLVFGKPQVKGKTTTILPIIGGLLALPDKRNRYGSLVFSLENNSRMATSIGHGYRPALAGSPPVNMLRAWMYRSTQTVVHAYVMWRFHKYCDGAENPNKWHCNNIYDSWAAGRTATVHTL